VFACASGAKDDGGNFLFRFIRVGANLNARIGIALLVVGQPPGHTLPVIAPIPKLDVLVLRVAGHDGKLKESNERQKAGSLFLADCT
jgi:hypothetical protein